MLLLKNFEQLIPYRWRVKSVAMHFMINSAVVLFCLVKCVQVRVTTVLKNSSFGILFIVKNSYLCYYSYCEILCSYGRKNMLLKALHR